jgi:hypothetical protein
MRYRDDSRLIHFSMVSFVTATIYASSVGCINTDKENEEETNPSTFFYESSTELSSDLRFM